MRKGSLRTLGTTGRRELELDKELEEKRMECKSSWYALEG